MNDLSYCQAVRRQPRALFVDSGVAQAKAIDALRLNGFNVSTARDFGQALDVVQSEPPDALITELRLGAFNGLHLVMRLQGHSPGAVAVVYTEFPDPVLEKQALQMGAHFLVKDEDTSPLLDLLATQMSSPEERRRGDRRRIAEPIAAHVANLPAHLVDIGHDGFCVEVRRGLVESPVEMNLPDFGLSVTARVVWARRTRDGLDGLRLGASLSAVLLKRALSGDGSSTRPDSYRFPTGSPYCQRSRNGQWRPVRLPAPELPEVVPEPTLGSVAPVSPPESDGAESLPAPESLPELELLSAGAGLFAVKESSRRKGAIPTGTSPFSPCLTWFVAPVFELNSNHLLFLDR